MSWSAGAPTSPSWRVSACCCCWACARSLTETLEPAGRQPFQFKVITRNYLAVIRHPQFLLRSLAIGLAFGGFGLYIASAASFVLQVLHLTETSFSWLFMPLIGGLVTGSIVSSKLAHRIKAESSVWLGLLIAALAMAFNLAYTTHFVAAVPWAVLPIMLYSFGLAIALPGMTVMTMGLFPTLRGLASSLQNFVQMLVFALISAFVAPLLMDSAFKLAVGAAVLMSSGAACWAWASRTRYREAA